MKIKQIHIDTRKTFIQEYVKSFTEEEKTTLENLRKVDVNMKI